MWLRKSKNQVNVLQIEVIQKGPRFKQPTEGLWESPKLIVHRLDGFVAITLSITLALRTDFDKAAIFPEALEDPLGMNDDVGGCDTIASSPTTDQSLVTQVNQRAKAPKNVIDKGLTSECI